MAKSTFSFYEWRQRMRALGFRASKAECARLLGIWPHTYDRYEADPDKAPAAYKLATIALLMGYRYDKQE